jgi:hypothetical protein
MKISINDTELYTLTLIQKQVIANDIHADQLDEDLKRRVHWILMHKYEQCMKRLRDEWMPKLKDRVAAVPTSDDAFAQLVFSQPDYKDRKSRDSQVADSREPLKS